MASMLPNSSASSCAVRSPTKGIPSPFSTRGSATHAKVDKVRAAAAKFRARHPQIASDGELLWADQKEIRKQAKKSTFGW